MLIVLSECDGAMLKATEKHYVVNGAKFFPNGVYNTRVPRSNAEMPQRRRPLKMLRAVKPRKKGFVQFQTPGLSIFESGSCSSVKF